MDHESFLAWLIHKGACYEAITWVIENKCSMAEAWDTCTEFSWMRWLIYYRNPMIEVPPFSNCDKIREAVSINNLRNDLSILRYMGPVSTLNESH